MNPGNARRIADGLTWSRIVSVLPITVLAVMELRWWVFALYIAAALTDLLDGRVARQAAPPENDVDLDGIADIVLSALLIGVASKPQLAFAFWNRQPI